MSTQSFAKHKKKQDMQSHAERHRAMLISFSGHVVRQYASADLLFDSEAVSENIQVCCKPKKSARIAVCIDEGQVHFDEALEDSGFQKPAKQCKFDLATRMPLAIFPGHVVKARKRLPLIFKQMIVPLGPLNQRLLRRRPPAVCREHDL